MATFPGAPPNPLGVKVELNLAGTWTDITVYTKVSAGLQISNMGRTDESSSISASQLALTLKNDGRFTPKNSAGAYYPNILRNTQVRVSVAATSATGVSCGLPVNANQTFESGVSNWSAVNSATIAQSSTQAHAGTFSMSVHGTGAIANPGAQSEQDAIVPGKTYTASAWFYNASLWASGVQLQINWFDASHVFLSDSFASAGSLPAATWTQVTVTGAAAPANAAFANIEPTIGGTPAVGNIFFIDDATLTPDGGSRFYGEISSWPPGQNVSGRDNYVQVTASGIWRRISATSASIGSAYTRYVKQLTGTSVPAAYWPMEDGSGSTAFVPAAGSGSNMTFSTVAPQFSADGTDFAGSDALPQMNAARLTATVSSGATPTSNMVRFALSVPAAGDSTGTAYSSLLLARILTSGTIATLSIWLLNSGTTGAKLQLNGYNSGGTLQFTGTIATPVNGVPVLVSAEMTATTWALKIIKPGAGAVLDQVSGSHSQTVAAVTSVQPSQQGLLTDTVLGQFGVWYVTTPSIVTAAAALGGFAGEFAVDRFTRLCAEQGIATTVIGSASAAMGPQADDTLASILQSIEDTDGGLLSESRDQFGLTYRTLGSLQNQAVSATLNYAGGVLGATLAPVYDDQLVKNQWTVTNTDGYAAQATLTSGAVSIQAVPNGVGVYGGTASTNANAHAQVNAIAQQRLFQGTVDDVRYPTVTMNMARAQAAPLFSTVPSLRVGDYIQITNIPATMGGSATSKQLTWGYSETISHNQWTITYNAVPELPFETAFSPGVYSVTQAPSGAVASGSAVGSSVSAAQLDPGLSGALSARSIGGVISFISAATPYDWTFAVTGTPADVTYFTCTEVQAFPIAAGDTFTNTSGLGGPFTVTSVDPPSGGNVTVHFTPDASSVMSVGTVRGGKNGDTWINTSGGNQVNQWSNGTWTPITWDGTSVINAATINASLIAAGTIIAGAVDGTTISGAQFIAYGSSGEILIYSGTPAAGNLIGSWSGLSGTDSHTNAYAAGLEVHTGGLVLDSQGSSPASVSGASTIYTSSGGRLRYLSVSGADMVLDRSAINLGHQTMTTQTAGTLMSGTLSYLAGEAQTGSEYEIEIDGTITSPSAGGALTYSSALWVDGAGFGVGSVVFGTVFMGTSQTISYTIRWRMSVSTTGAGGQVTAVADGGASVTNVTLGNLSNGGGAGSVAINSTTTALAFDTTSNHTLGIYQNWGAGAGRSGHSAITYRTKITRRY